MVDDGVRVVLGEATMTDELMHARPFEDVVACCFECHGLLASARAHCAGNAVFLSAHGRR